MATVRCLNHDGSLLNIDEWHRCVHDSWAHRGYYETMAKWIEDREYYLSKGGEALAEEMGYTEELLVEKVRAIHRKYTAYCKSGGVI